jgi:hypothetical protein
MARSIPAQPNVAEVFRHASNYLPLHIPRPLQPGVSIAQQHVLSEPRTHTHDLELSIKLLMHLQECVCDLCLALMRSAVYSCRTSRTLQQSLVPICKAYMQ